MEKTAHYKNGYYETAIIFKNDQVYLPDNIRIARVRLSSKRNKILI